MIIIDQQTWARLAVTIAQRVTALETEVVGGKLTNYETYRAHTARIEELKQVRQAMDRIAGTEPTAEEERALRYR